jgi:outer membrane protein assembly factor BamB
VKYYLSLNALVLSLLLAICGGCTVGRKGFDWPSWRGPAGNGISKESGWNPKALADGPTILWKADVGQGYSSVAIQGSRLVTAGMKDGNYTAFCLAADSGTPVWQYAYEDFDDSQATPAIDGDSVYALSKAGILLCLDARNGKLRWQKDLVADYGAVRPAYGFAGSPVVRGNLLVLTANTAGMALDKKTGEKVWSSEPPPAKFEASNPSDTNGADYATPVVYARQGKSYALIASWKGISSVEVTTGRPLWVYEWELYSGRHVTDPLVIGDRVYVAQNFHPPYKDLPGSLLLTVGAEKPALLWKSSDLTTEISDAVALDGYLYGGQGGPYRYGASLRCVDLETGKLKWERIMSEAMFIGCVSLMAADGKLIILTDDGMLVIAEASAEGYKEISRCEVPKGETGIAKFWTAPVLCNGRIYCRNYYGELVCIDVSK